MFNKLYSPVQKIKLFNLTNFYIKRDDLIDPYISGNKWRKLKYLLKDILSNNKNHIVTFGGAYSNHLVATAALASKAQLKATAFVRGDAVDNEMLLICRLYGMQLIFVDRDLYKNKTLLFETHFGNDLKAYFIDEGGASELGILGCAEIITELTEEYDHIFCAAGTGTTAAGLLKGINNQNLKTKLHVIPVLKPGNFIEDIIKSYTTVNDSNFKIHLDYHFGGYAKTKPDLIDFMKTFIAQTGVMIDPVYTAKMFYAINHLSEQNLLNKDDKILAIHTGGLLGILGMKDKF